MATILRAGALLAALFLDGVPLAQEPPSLDARLAAAKLAETSGKLAEAEQALRGALVAAQGAERSRVAAALGALLVRLGRGDEAAALVAGGGQDAPQGDPIQRLLAVLDSGAGSNAAVKEAMDQLTTLGSLVVPPLVAALPELGPFGLRNAIELLAAHDDPRVQTALAQLVDTADPAVVATVAGRLHQFSRGVALPLAARFAEARFPARVRCLALEAMLAHRVQGPEVRDLALRLAEEPDDVAQSRVLNAVAESPADWVVDVWAVLKDRATGDVRENAIAAWLRRQRGAGEDLVLAELARMRSHRAPQYANEFALANPAWVRVGLLALQAGGDPDLSLLAKVEWWRAADQAVPLLLRRAVPPIGAVRSAVAGAIREMAARGWRAAPGLDEALAGFCSAGQGFDTFVAALPVDAEDRAIAVHATLRRDWASDLASSVVRAERSWHRLVAKHLAAATLGHEVDPHLLQRDWSGAPSEAAALLAELARRWPQGPDGGRLNWHGSFVDAHRRCTDLPVAGILPFLGIDHGGANSAWQVIMDRDPTAAFVYARGSARLTTYGASLLLRALPEHGGAGDVPLAIRVLERLRGLNLDLQPAGEFLARHGAGNLDVVAFARLPIPPGLDQFVWNTIARQAARGVRVEDLASLIELIPALWSECATVVMAALEPQLTPAHAPLLVRALEARLAAPQAVDSDGDSEAKGPVAAWYHTRWLVLMLGRVGDAAVLPVLQRLLERDDLRPVVIPVAARAAIQVAGAGRRRLLAGLLASPRSALVHAAVESAELRTDAELRDLGRAAVLRLGHQWTEPRALFAALAEDDRLALAVAVLEHERMPQFTGELCGHAIEVIGARKDVRFVAVLARAARHPESYARGQAARALGNTFAREAAPPLIELLKDDVEEVRKEAQKALDQIANYLEERARWEARLK